MAPTSCLGFSHFSNALHAGFATERVGRRIRPGNQVPRCRSRRVAEEEEPEDVDRVVERDVSVVVRVGRIVTLRGKSSEEEIHEDVNPVRRVHDATEIYVSTKEDRLGSACLQPRRSQFLFRAIPVEISSDDESHRRPKLEIKERIDCGHAE